MGRVIWSLGFTRRREDERIRQEVNQEDCQCLCFCEFLGGGGWDMRTAAMNES